jgi:hypothetical protein
MIRIVNAEVVTYSEVLSGLPPIREPMKDEMVHFWLAEIGVFFTQPWVWHLDHHKRRSIRSS